MTEQEFFDKLKTCGKFKQTLSGIRQEASQYCPIVAVAAKEGILDPASSWGLTTMHEIYDYYTAGNHNLHAMNYAEKMGLDKKFAQTVIRAADTNIEGENLANIPENLYMAMRTRLIETCEVEFEDTEVS